MVLMRGCTVLRTNSVQFTLLRRKCFYNQQTALKTAFSNHQIHNESRPVLYNPSPRSITENFYVRSIHTSVIYYDKSKVEDSLKEKRKQKQTPAQAQPATEASVSSSEKAVPVPEKKSLLVRIWLEVKHYYHGFRLLFLDSRIAARTLWKLFNGKTVVRRERNQFRRAVSDIFRLAPFSIFIIIPFAEFALPFALKLFPNMLPSTFESSDSKDKRFKKELKLKLEMAKFLQDTVEDIAVRAKKSSKKNDAAQNFVAFFQKVRDNNEPPTNDEIIKHAKLFEDQLTLDNLTRQQLTALCRLLKVPAVGTNELLRFLLQMKLQRLHTDDMLIQQEGVDSLTTTELVTASQDRGMRALGVSRMRLKQQLSEWVDLHINHDVPNSLLLLSRVLYLSENVPVEAKLKEAISSMSDSAAGEAAVRAAELNLERADNTARYNAAVESDASIAKEQSKKAKKEEKQQPEEAATTDPVPEVEKEPKDEKDKDILVDTAPVLTDKARVICDDSKKLTTQDIDAIDMAIDKISGEKEDIDTVKSDLKDLREDVEEYQSDVESLNTELKTLEDELIGKDAKASRRIQNRISKMIGKMENSLASLEREDQATDIQKRQLNDLVSVQQMMRSIKSFKDIPDDRLMEIIKILDTNSDGHIDVSEAKQIIKMVNEEDVEVTHEQLQHIVKFLQKAEPVVKGKTVKAE